MKDALEKLESWHETILEGANISSIFKFIRKKMNMNGLGFNEPSFKLESSKLANCTNNNS